MDKNELLERAESLGACDPGLEWGACLSPDAPFPAVFDRDSVVEVKGWFQHHRGYRFMGWCVGRLIRVGDLSGADLRGFKLCSARMPRADLRGADLRGADLRGADLRGADLRGAALNEAIMPKGWQDAVKAY